ncbi:MAG: hypothetical protein LBQ71_12555 [Hungatella sp.]|jgi:Mor family transcriptional regulator|nr:hypothetical protein [Hungatella sp.]
MNDLISDLTPEMLPEGLFREMAEQIGVDNLIKLSKLVGGTTFYMPKTESILKPARDAKIRAEFNGYNHVQLAKKYDVTERWVRAICGDGHMQGQYNLFDGYLE